MRVSQQAASRRSCTVGEFKSEGTAVAMVRIAIMVTLVSCVFMGNHTADAATGRPSVAEYVRVESSTDVVDVLYRYGHNDASSSGAYGVNTSAPRSAWFIEEQRAGGVDVIAGALRHDRALIAEGLKMFHWGLARQASNGSFPGSAWPFHGVAFFLTEAAPALLFLLHSSYSEQFAKEAVWEKARMRKAAYAMVRSVGGAGKIDDTTKNHRQFEAAIALGATGVLTHDKTLTHWSTLYAWKGIRMERKSGVMPEDGGHDSGYQALGMVDATKYLELVARGSLYSALYGALAKGESWELSRIEPDGSVNQSGDTRTVGCKEQNTAGACKTVFYAPIFSALARWAAISGDARFATASQSVWHRSGYGG
jgi:hypothetical protein